MSQGKNILIVDDLVDTAGTLCNAVEALRKAGAASVYAACTHPVLSGEAIDAHRRRRTSSCCWSRTRSRSGSSHRRSRSESVSHIFSEAIRRSFNHESISSLFDVDKS